MQKHRKLFNQDFRAVPALSISSEHMESGTRAFQTLTAVGRKKSRKIHLSGVVGILQSSITSCMTSLAYSQSFILQTPFYKLKLQSNQSRNGARTKWVSCPASQVVDYIPCQPTGAGEVNELESLRPMIFSFFVKPRKQDRCS